MVNLGNVLIIGDSYSTFVGYIPEGYTPNYGPNIKEYDVLDVEQTWWKQVLNNTKSNLVLNCSYSGSAFSHAGYEKKDYKDRSFITRLQELIDNGFFQKNKIDTLIVFGGTNDAWNGEEMGEIKQADWTEEELYQFHPACCKFFDMVTKQLPKMRVFSIINCNIPRVDKGLPAICDLYGIDYVTLHDLDKIYGHPTALGMKQIAEQVLAFIEKKYQ